MDRLVITLRRTKMPWLATAHRFQKGVQFYSCMLGAAYFRSRTGGLTRGS
jgi:hypothetical protein